MTGTTGESTDRSR
ncbi:hypothetical protein LINPERPRIM_LOCUS32030 [Linum perenne]